MQGADLLRRAGGEHRVQDRRRSCCARTARRPRRARSPAPRASPTHHTFSAPQLHVTVQGEGPPVVLSHALGLDLHMWDEFGGAARQDDARVLRYDHRGHGESAVPAGPYAMDDLVDDAARAHPRMGPRPGRVDRPVDGRHGRPGARHPPPRAAARRRARQHRRLAIPRRRGDLGGAHRRGREGRHGGGRRRGRRALPARRLPRRASRPRRRAARAPAALRPGRLRRLLPRRRRRRLARPARRRARADARDRRRARRRRDARDGARHRRAHRRRRARASSTTPRTSASPRAGDASTTPSRRS